MTRTDIENAIKSKPELVVCEYTYNQIGTDDLGLPTYEIKYIGAPTNFKLVRVIETPTVAILENLDYVAAG